MSYQLTDWKDRVVERPRTFTVTNNPDGTMTLTPSPGVVVQEGTPVNAAQLKRMEQGIWDAYIMSGEIPIDDNTQLAIERDVEGRILITREFVSGMLFRLTTMVRTGDILTKINVKVYSGDGITVLREYEDSLNRDEDGVLLGVTRGVIS